MNIISTLALIYFVGCVTLGVVLSLGSRGTAWFFALKTWVRLVVAASVVLGAGVGVYGQVLKAESKELTFATDDYVWPSVPIRVHASPIDGYVEATSAAIIIWNRSLKCELFRGEGTAAAAQVRVRGFDGLPCGKAFRDLKGSEAKNKAEGTWDCKDGTHEVLLNNPGDLDTAFRAVLHGLGHVVRLAHDESGIMADTILPLTIVEPNRKDITALRERYCNLREP